MQKYLFSSCSICMLCKVQSVQKGRKNLGYFSLKERPWLKFHLFFSFLQRRENAAVWKVVFGISNLDHPSGFMQIRLVRTIILHPRYNRAVVDYDISIVELDEDINETSYVRPVCLPSKDQLVQPDTYCYITGWGHMGNKSKMNISGTFEKHVKLLLS